jgi:pimeloyl-ACP methyl ester carboxylesterase
MKAVPPRRRTAASAPPPAAPDTRAPGALLMLLEGRAPWECAALIAALPWLRRLPRGDGHPVLVFPGLGATDVTTAPLRSFLQDLGYSAYPWKQGFNLGPRQGVLENARTQAERIADRHGEPLSLVGWSLGGLYAREIAKQVPASVRCVVTLGSPFAGHPRATNAWRFYELVSGQRVVAPALMAQLKVAPPVPTTSIYSRSDGIVAWQCSVADDAPRVENIEVHASHIGMGMNPLALYAVADRLRQDPRAWKRFDVQGARRWFFRTTGMPPLEAAAG